MFVVVRSVVLVVVLRMLDVPGCGSTPKGTRSRSRCLGIS
jgi:hypothetical protein